MSELTPRVVMLAISGGLNLALLFIIVILLDRIKLEREYFNSILKEKGLK